MGVGVIGRAAAAALALCCMARPGAAGDLPPLEPYQLLRSLQLVQDRIAGGDQAGLPLQGRLMVMTDAGFREASAARMADRRNIKALIAYGLSGGNPETVVSLASLVPRDDPLSGLSLGVVGYVTGREETARSGFAKVDPLTLDADIAAYVALAKGNLNVDHDPELAVAMMRIARLLAPGTLVEEAALRRMMALEMKSGDMKAFIRASVQYARRFHASPYAEQFAEMFTNAVVEMDAAHASLALEAVDGAMPVPYRDAIYLRVARKAAIRGTLGLAELAAAKIGAAVRHADAGKDGDEVSPRGGGNDTAALRSRLYSGINSITDEGGVEALAKLDGIDDTKLPREDRRLLKAAKAVARAVLEPIASTSGPAPAGPNEAADGAMAEGGGMAPAGEAPPAEFNDTDALLSEARSRLQEIDALLEKETR
ncbi:MAG: hypothetical protein R3D45_10775 [Rhizobiaceae bacterium]